MVYFIHKVNVFLQRLILQPQPECRLCLGRRPAFSHCPSESVFSQRSFCTNVNRHYASLYMQIGDVTTFKLSDNASKVLLMSITFSCFALTRQVSTLMALLHMHKDNAVLRSCNIYFRIRNCKD